MKAPSKEQLLQDVLSDASWKEIADKYGYSSPTFLRKLARRYDLPKRRTILKPSESELRQMIQSGLTPYQIADRLGYGEGGWSNIYKYCREYNIEFDYSPNYDLRSVPFTQRQKDIALASVLGDGYLHPTGKGSYYLSFAHGEKQFGYLDWKLHEFKNYVTSDEYRVQEADFHGNRPVYSFNTISHPYLKELHELCYIGGVKTVTQAWLDLLSPLSLAVWYMDDGSRNKRYGTIVLCTNAFPLEQQALIAEHFANCYWIEPKIEPRRNGQYVLRINASQSHRFLEIIAPYVPECMSYKLG